jgi:uncharacterized glyoxalase superfamily metalloenzyme YdcJ
VNSGGHVPAWQLRARFAQGLSALYGREVPAYQHLLRTCLQVNAAVLAREGAGSRAPAEFLGSIDRVNAERHGAIRVGSPAELAQVARLFAAFGMYPVGFYDLRDAPAPVPVVSTAFRPIEPAELARNPFRVFTSLLATADPRFFDPSLRRDVTDFLGRRELFAPRLLELADRATTERGLSETAATELVGLAVDAFALSGEPVDRAWYERLAAVSPVAADIAGVTSTHINHLTPRVLDIDALYTAMNAAGIAMIEEIQGPPRWSGPPVLLRQTSFRALAETRLFREPDGTLFEGELRVRFGEVEARGLALTPNGRDYYDALMIEVQRTPDRATDLFEQNLPATLAGFAESDLAFFEFRLTRERVTRNNPAMPQDVPTDLTALIEGGWVSPEPIVYEDFLPRSAAGIFASNLSHAGSVDQTAAAAELDADWLAGALEQELYDPMRLYAAQRAASLAVISAELGIAPPGLAGLRVKPSDISETGATF